MNKKTISKIILSIIAIMLITCISKSVLADGNTIDLSNSILNGKNETTEGKNNTVADTKNNTTNNNTSKNNTTSTYTDNKIPYTGPAETIIMGTLFVVCGAVGIYTFIKLSEYNNV